MIWLLPSLAGEGSVIRALLEGRHLALALSNALGMRRTEPGPLHLGQGLGWESWAWVAPAETLMRLRF